MIMMHNFVLTPAFAFLRPFCPKKHPQELLFWGVFSVDSLEDEEKLIKGDLLFYLSHIIDLLKDLPQSIYA